MAFYSGSQTNAAGSLVTILDAELVNNEYWEVYDTPATNERVYYCSYPGAEFFLHVADNQTNYATVAIWEDWDADSGVGVGLGSSSATVYWRKTTGNYWVILHDYHFIYVCFGTNLNYAHWAGNPERWCPQYNTPMLAGVGSTTTTGINPLGGLAHTTSSTRFLCLDLEDMRLLSCWGEYSTDAPSAVQGYMGLVFPISSTDYFFAQESLVCDSQYNSLGKLPGVVAMGTSPSGIAHGDTVTIDGDTWECVVAGFGVVLRKT